MRVTITTIHDDATVKREWTFTNLRDGLQFVLDRFVESRRPEPRGRYSMAGHWQRIDRRQNTIEPPPHTHLKAEVIKAIADQMEVIDVS